MADSGPITSRRLRAALAGTRPPVDPTDVVLPPYSERWPASVRDRLVESLRPAGVLVPVFERNQAGLTVLLTRRAAELKHHAGQVSFPGGRMEAGDTDIAATALRETAEEVGIAIEHISVIGYLQPMPTITGYAVTPVIGLVNEATELALDHSEVESAFEVPLAFLFDRANQVVVEREVHGRMVPLVEYCYAGQRIWGATASIILQLIKVIKYK